MPAQNRLDAELRVHAPRAEAPTVNRRLFGKFTEHLGRNVYGGAWAQLVENPDFAPASAWPDPAVLLRRLHAAESTDALPLASAVASGLPPWWCAQDAHPQISLQPTGPVLSFDGPGQVQTPIYPPTHRVRRYLLRLTAHTTAPMHVSLLEGGRRPWASVLLTPDASGGTREMVLEGAAPAPPGTPFHLRITAAGPGRLQLRRCLLLPADHLDGWDPEVVARMRAANLPLLRFPGGNFVSGYHWRDGVGPLEGRPVLPNPAWPEVEWNHVGTDEWLRLCAHVGAEPLICVNAGDGTADEAADWVEYCNGEPSTPMGALRVRNGHPAPYDVRLWEVGNELYGAWQTGATDAAGYARRYQEFARAMRARMPGITLIANGHTELWNRTLVAASAEPVTALSHHALYGGFAAEANPDDVYLEHMAFPPAYRRQWDALTAPLVARGQAPRLAITELQIFTQRPNLPHNGTLTEALWDACILNEAIRAGESVSLITHSALVNHGGGLRKERGIVYEQPAWWVTHLYGSAPHPLRVCAADLSCPTFTAERAERLPTLPNVPWLDALALATATGDHAFVLFLVNRHPQATGHLMVTLPGRGGVADIATLSAPSYMAANTWREPDAVRPQHRRQPWLAGTVPLHVPPLAPIPLS